MKQEEIKAIILLEYLFRTIIFGDDNFLNEFYDKVEESFEKYRKIIYKTPGIKTYSFNGWIQLFFAYASEQRRVLIEKEYEPTEKLQNFQIKKFMNEC